MKKDDRQKIGCIICGQEIKTDEAYAFNLSEEIYYFCESHAEPFKMGMNLGQLEINAKCLASIADLPDPMPKVELRRVLGQLAPMSKVHFLMSDKQEEILQIETDIKTPSQLYYEIDKVVIGQNSAKRAVSVAVINHIQSINDHDTESIGQSGKHHVLMLGKSGSGKTLIATTIAKLFNLPFVMGDATNYSPTGFQGADADSVVHDLILDTEMNFELAERGIVFIDEIDKISCANKNQARYESFIGSTQSTLLKLIEGKNIKIPGPVFGEMPGSSCNISSEKMLFFFGGAFNGLSDIVAKKMGKKDRTLGFKRTGEDKNKELDDALKSYEIFSLASREEMVESLIEYGMLSELVGRIPTIVALKPLLKDDLKKVLFDSEASPIKRQQYIFAQSGYNLSFSDEFIEKIVDKSYASAVGTRALDSYIKVAVSYASFDLLTLDKYQTGDILITPDCVIDPAKYEKSNIKVVSTPSYPVSMTV